MECLGKVDHVSRVDRRLCGPADAAVAVGEGVLAAGQVVVAVGGVQEVGPVAALGVVTAALLALRRAAGHDVPNLLRRCQSYIAIVSTNTPGLSAPGGRRPHGIHCMGPDFEPTGSSTPTPVWKPLSPATL